MPSLKHDFLFDVNFGLGHESVFTLVDRPDVEPPPPPPIEGYFLEFQGPNDPFLLLNGQNMTLL